MARINALNNQAGFVPTNINAVGYITVSPGSGATGGGDGYIAATGSISTQSDLNVLGGAQIVGSSGGFGLSVQNDMQCASDLTVGGTISSQGNIQTASTVVTPSITFPGGVQSSPFVPNASLPMACVSLYSVDQAVGQTYTIPSNFSKFTMVALQYANSCGVALTNITVANPTFFPDQARFITIAKSAMSIQDYTVNITAPAGYKFYSPSGTDQTNYTIPAGKFSVTFVMTGGLFRLYLYSSA
jgi:hypothetical protein